MSSKPETQFIKSVHKHLPKALHAEKMNNPYRGGTADVWYSGGSGDLWVEYKFLPKLPKVAGITPSCSPLQFDWLRDRCLEGRNIAVIVGCPAGGVIFRNLAWEHSIPPLEFERLLQSRTDIANWILGETGEPIDKVGRGDIQNTRRVDSSLRGGAGDMRRVDGRPQGASARRKRQPSL